MYRSRLDIKKLEVGKLATNCYIVVHKETEDAIIIDPGDDAEYIISVLQREQLTPKQIIATHGHFDHVLGVLEIKLAYDIPFFIHKADEFLLKRAVDSSDYFTGIKSDPVPMPDGYIDETSKIILSDVEFSILETPGHTPGSISLFNKDEKVLFVGDVIFKEGVGRTDFSYSDFNKLKESIGILTKLKDKYTVYPGHEDTFSLDESQNHSSEFLL
jgi:glyoxylase-like metal-dependent hydrolase (beta-lactamase superfamily II)